MTINEVAQLYGVSHQAVYKRIKSAGLKLAELKDKATGQLTPEGEEKVVGLFAAENAGPPPDSTKVAELRNEVEKLRPEVEKLRNQVENLEEKLKTVTEERDYLRTTLDATNKNLENAQQLQAMTLSKLPSAPLLTDGSGGRLRRAWAALRGKGEK